MAAQPPITSFFGSKKRRATEALERNAKLMKGDATLLKVTKIESSVEKPKDPLVKQDVPEKPKIITQQTTPRKNGGCDIRSYMTSKSPYRPDCKSDTPVKFFRTEARDNETTPAKPTTSIMKSQGGDRSQSAVKKSIWFEDEEQASPKLSETPLPGENEQHVSLGDSCQLSDRPLPAVARALAPDVTDTDDIIKAANDLVEKMKNKSRTLSDLGKVKPTKKPEIMTSGQLKKKLARSAKLSELKSSLTKLGQQASELIKLEKKKKEMDQPKLTKFDSIEVDVPRSPHKGALASPVKSPAKPAYERFAHLVHRTTAPATGVVCSGAATLPLPFSFQRLLDLFTATDTVCSMMMNRGELVTFRKLKPAVQELTRKTLTERHIAQMAAVLPEAYAYRQEKLRNFGSTSKLDRYELVLTPCIGVPLTGGSTSPPKSDSNVVTAAERKKMTPRTLQERKQAFHHALLLRAIAKHEEFLESLDPPLRVGREQLTRWHPNFPLDLIPDVAPAALPEPPSTGQAPSSARDVLERAKQLLSSNLRMRKALEAAEAASCPPPEADLTKTSGEGENKEGEPGLDPEVKQAVDKRLAAHDPLKGIPKSLLDRIRAKQAVKALEGMQMSASDEQEHLLLSQLPDTARIVRTLFVDNQKGVLPWSAVVEKVAFSSKRSKSKGDVEVVLRRLIKELPDWLSVFTIKSAEYLKLNRAAAFAPIMEKLDKMAAERHHALP